MSLDVLMAEMRADAAAIAERTRHWRERPGPGTAVRARYFRPGSRQARMFALMVPGQPYGAGDCARLLGLSSVEGANVLRTLARAGHVRQQELEPPRGSQRFVYVRPE